jgi:BirA family biotin operon repressor/biotin-[acetyl-CoA-carboxylase] ligase
MFMSNKEYQLFKSLCYLKCIQKTHRNEKLITNIKFKGLTIKRNNNFFCLDQELIALSENKIRQLINDNINQLILQCKIVYSIDSTNKVIATYPINKGYSVLLTEFQTNGKGRREKIWSSSFAENICMSIKFRLYDTTCMTLIPLITAVAICRSLKKIGINNCQIKWPNDIYFKGKKLAGILIESRCNINNGAIFIVGIGLNVNMKINNEIDQLWTSLRNEKNKMFDRNIIISSLLSEIVQDYNNLGQFDINLFKKEWSLLDYLYGSEINIVDNNLNYLAIACGISNDGALLIKNKNNILKKLYSADVSIRASKLK